MKRDFTLKVYSQLLKTFLTLGYKFQTLEDYICKPEKKVVILRHDVDNRPITALTMARIENKIGIRSSYYFRIVKESYNPKIIIEIVKLNHELGYHYEDLSKTKGDYGKAFKLFINNLETFRQFYPVKTMCMHGSVYSKYDNRWLWKEFNYKNYGIICEPYLDLNFDEILYLTDTSRMWDGNKFSIRDKVESTYNFKLHSTYDIIKALNKKILPDEILINTHPARWYDRLLPWSKEFIVQNTKNIIKRIVVKIK